MREISYRKRSFQWWRRRMRFRVIFPTVLVWVIIIIASALWFASGDENGLGFLIGVGMLVYPCLSTIFVCCILSDGLTKSEYHQYLRCYIAVEREKQDRKHMKWLI